MSANVHYLPPAEPLTCACGFTFKTLAGLEAHNRAVHAERPSLPVEENLRRAREMLHRLDGFTDPPGPEAGEGRCDQCEAEARIRWTIGRFALCRGCANSRRNVRGRLKETPRPSSGGGAVVPMARRQVPGPPNERWFRKAFEA